MSTLNSKLGFLFGLMAGMFMLGACGEKELSHGEVTVLKEFTAGQGQVHQTVPLEGVEVRFYVPKNGAEHLETIDVTGADGMTQFDYEYETRVWAEATYEGDTYRELLFMRVGETYKADIIIPE